MARFDALIVGAGPAGAATAYRAARRGASILLVDKARFPRDKPCGGGVTLRAARELPVAIDAIAERLVDRFEVRLRYGRGHERTSAAPLCMMTQRRRLDAHLVACAVEAGAEFRDGARVSDVRMDDDGVDARVGGVPVRAATLVAACGANGTTGRSLKLAEDVAYGVALEGNVPYEHVPQRFRDRIVLVLGAVHGGYAWAFPKGDHVNVGAGGWATEAPRLREHLTRFCREYEIDPGRIEARRGYRLPYRRGNTVLARGRALAVGDAAGLVDPVSGDGIYEAAVSGRLAARAIIRMRDGDTMAFDDYARAVHRYLHPLAEASWDAKRALDRFPRTTFAVMRSRRFWPAVVELLDGTTNDPAKTRRHGRLPLAALRVLARNAPAEPVR